MALVKAVYKRPHVILGTMTFGTGCKNGGRISDNETIREVVDTFKSFGHFELDTARMYCDGNTEEKLGELGYSVSPDFSIHTKVYPVNLGDHKPEKLKATFKASLAALKTDKVDVFYLHAPDHGTPFEETLAAVQELYEAGHFKELGLSNYAAWEVMKVWKIAEAKGYVKPTLYQGMYNALTRDVERELFPCLRSLNMRFYAYNPLCGGLLTGRHQLAAPPVADGTRFDASTKIGGMYLKRYWNGGYFAAVETVREAAERAGIAMVDVAHRWMFWHSKLDADAGDGVVIGASSVAHARENLESCEEGPLPKEVVEALDAAYEITKGIQAPYFR
ncbi:Aldo/keto reductase [Zopfochytrium polystomum]|nr:Aldo/keto reductase [Zopfochytrium polystomum]